VRVLVVFCHPLPDSFGAHVRDVTLSALEAHDSRLVDLYDGRDLPRWFSNGDAADLGWAQAVVLIYPTWWSSFPAPLMGWIEDGLDRGCWRHLTRLVAVTTHGSSRLVNAITGGIGARIVRKGLPGEMAQDARGVFLAMYSMDRSDEKNRRRFAGRMALEVPHALS
jgi:NAD(P)H dehydrogenase (quinone)